MRENLRGLSKEKSDDFVRYIAASSCNEKTGFQQGQGNARFIGEEYVVEYSFNLKMNESNIFVILLIKLDKNGCLISIENLNNKEDERFNSILQEYITSLCKKVLIKEKKKFYRRSYLSAISGSNLQGEYWISNFRFAPLFPEDNSRLINAERIFVIDQVVEAIDDSHASELADLNSQMFSSFLSFILDIGLDSPVVQEKYVLNDNMNGMIRKSTQIFDINHPKRMPKRKEICGRAKYENSIYDNKEYANEILSCPKETRSIFKNLHEADPETYYGFLNACRMYQLALILGQRRQTVHIAYLIGAIDSIVQTNKEKYKSITDFMIKYSSATEEICNLIYYKIRCAHWHSGELPLGELNFTRNFIFDSSAIPRLSIFSNSHELIRLSILNWLNEKIEFKIKQDL